MNDKNGLVMDNSQLRQKVVSDLENLVAFSCKSSKRRATYKAFHEALLKKYYNATDVEIDYHRHRVKMNIIMDDKAYKAGKVNTHLPILPANLLYDNLKAFLKSCIDPNSKNLGFYAQLIRQGEPQEDNSILV